MSSIRINEIARELNIKSKDVLEACSRLGIDVKSHSSSVTPGQKKSIIAELKKGDGSLAGPGRDKTAKKPGKKNAIKKEEKDTSAVKESKAKKSVASKKETGPLKEKIAKKQTTAKKETEGKKDKNKLNKESIKVKPVPEPESESGEDEEKRVFSREKYDWNEEKRVNIRKVLDMELDKEEKEGRLRARIKPKAKKIRDLKDVSRIKEKVDYKETIVAGEAGEKAVKRSEIKKLLELPEGVTIKQLSEKINVPSSEIIQVLLNMGEMLNINQPLDKDLVEILSHEFNFRYSIIDFEDRFEDLFKDSEKDLVQRPPIVTVMGHVDHGKTTLLDTIRKANVVSSEAGGITQRIGAYQTVFKDRKITFIDTPGHEAFTTMRARGAMVTDIVVIIVAADDGIMPQTVEAINHAKDAGVPIIVVINKTDLPNVEPEKIKQGFTEYNLVPEAWGGDTIFVNISAKKGTNIDELLEMILLVSDMNEIRGNPGVEGSGFIIESRLDKGFGSVGTVLVKRGTIRVGDFFVTGNSYGRIRTIKDENGKNLKKAGLSQPVEISGFTSAPQAGDKFFVVKNEKVAKDNVNRRIYREKLSKLSETRKHITLEDFSEIAKISEAKKLKIVLKAESNGSLDAVEKALKDIENEKIKIEVVHKGVGAISDGDILLASASDAIVIGFGVVASPKAKLIAKDEDIEVRAYDIIYKLIDDIKLASEGLLEPEFEERIKGTVEIREIFRISKVGNVAGCYVQEGEVERGSQARVIRDGKIIYDSRISTLHRFKDDVKKVSAGYECGITIENFQDLDKGDILEVYALEEIKR